MLLITSDQQRYDAIGCYGNRHIFTPNLDRMAREGVHFINHTTSCAICTPARASMLLGQYPHTHGAWTVGTTVDPNCRGLSHWLADAGWRTGLFGKAHFEPEQSQYVLRVDLHDRPYYGFHEFHITEDHNIGEYMDWIRREHPEHVAAARNNTHEDLRDTPLSDQGPGRLQNCYLSTLPENLHQTAWIADRTVDFIRESRRAERPFFAWCSFVDPHQPYNPPREFAEKYDPATLPPPIASDLDEAEPPSYCHVPGLLSEEYLRLKAYYYAMVTHIDAHVGRVLETLRGLGALEDTIVVFTSDHGDYLGDHGLVHKGTFLFESIVRAPMIIRAGRACEVRGAVRRAFSQHEDLAPTIMDLLGLPIPATVQGVSLADAMRRETSALDDRSVAFNTPMEGEPTWGIRRGPWKLLFHEDPWGRRLFNLDEDPDETINRLDDPSCREVLRELEAEMLRWFLSHPAHRLPRTHRW